MTRLIIGLIFLLVIQRVNGIGMNFFIKNSVVKAEYKNLLYQINNCEYDLIIISKLKRESLS